MPSALVRAGALPLVVALATLAGCSPADRPDASPSTGALGRSGDAGAGVVTPTSRAPGADAAAELERLVPALATALAAHETPGAGIVDPASGAWRDRLAARARAMAVVGVDRLRLEVDARTLRISGDRASVTAVGGYHLRGAAPQLAPTTLALVARRTTAGWRLSGEQPGPSLPTPWDLPGARRVDGPGVIVLGDAPADRLRWYADAAGAAWREVGAAWPRRPAGAPVVLLPRTGEEFRTQVRASTRDVTSIAALTVGSLATGRTSLGDMVVVNPAVHERLTEEGRRTILRHELVHVAVRGTTTGPVPRWLAEGYAVEASWGQGPVPPQLRARARAWPPDVLRPSALPSDGDLTDGDLTRAYDVSAVLVRDLVSRHGRPTVVRFYEAVAAGSTVETAAVAVLGEPVSAVVAHWRSALTEAART